MKNRKTIILITVAVVAAVSSVLLYLWLSGSSATEISIETLKAKKGTVTTLVTATGTVQPTTQVEVGTQVSGVVEKVYVDYNSIVTEGQLIAELDRANLKATLMQAQAQYDNAVNEKQYLQTVLNRQQSLYNDNFLSQAEYDLALYNLNNAIGTVTQRLSDLEKAKSNLSYTYIYSPINGVVLSKNIEEGQTVAASYSTPTLFTIAQDLSQMQVEADVDEADIGQVAENQRVTFTVDAFPENEFNGIVTQVRLNPTTSSNVVTYTVVIEANNPDLKLKPGMTATISIYTLELDNVLTIESKAVNFKPNMQLLATYQKNHSTATPHHTPTNNKSNTNTNGTTVWVVNNNIIKPQTVSLGASDGVNIQVISGLTEGDELVYSLKETESSGSSSEPTESSNPFMPQPAGSNRKR